MTRQVNVAEEVLEGRANTCLHGVMVLLNVHAIPLAAGEGASKPQRLHLIPVAHPHHTFDLTVTLIGLFAARHPQVDQHHSTGIAAEGRRGGRTRSCRKRVVGQPEDLEESDAVRWKRDLVLVLLR